MPLNNSILLSFKSTFVSLFSANSVTNKVQIVSSACEASWFAQTIAGWCERDHTNLYQMTIFQLSHQWTAAIAVAVSLILCARQMRTMSNYTQRASLNSATGPEVIVALSIRNDTNLSEMQIFRIRSAM